MFALVDGNNLYASCERVFRPDLNGRPVVVLSNNDGCAIARSNEAKALGIKMATDKSSDLPPGSSRTDGSEGREPVASYYCAAG